MVVSVDGREPGLLRNVRWPPQKRLGMKAQLVSPTLDGLLWSVHCRHWCCTNHDACVEVTQGVLEQWGSLLIPLAWRAIVYQVFLNGSPTWARSRVVSLDQSVF